jgi:hypothetical protein
MNLIKKFRSLNEDIQFERSIRKTLRAIANQRVTLILPGNYPFIERSPLHTESFEVNAQTCLIRGWVAILNESIPVGEVKFEGNKPVLPVEMKYKTTYRLTEGGWAALNRSHNWIIATFIVGLLALLASIISVIIALAD